MLAGLVCKLVVIGAIRHAIVKHVESKNLLDGADEMFERKAEELRKKFADY